METKQKIREIVEKLPNEVLDDFQQIEKSTQERIRFSRNLNNTLTEDEELLEIVGLMIE